MKLLECRQCRDAPNHEEVALGKELSPLQLREIADILYCESCGTYYDQWTEEGRDGVMLYRNRLSYVEAIYSLESSKISIANQRAKNLRLSLSTRIVAMQTAMSRVPPNLTHYFMINFMHYHHARGDTKAMNVLATRAEGPLKRMIEWHRQDAPIIQL